MSDEHLRLGLRALKAQGFGALDDAQLLELLQGTYRELVERNVALLEHFVATAEWAPSADRPAHLGGSNADAPPPPDAWPPELQFDYAHNYQWLGVVLGAEPKSAGGSFGELGHVQYMVGDCRGKPWPGLPACAERLAQAMIRRPLAQANAAQMDLWQGLELGPLA